MNINNDLKNIENLIKYAAQKTLVFASRIRTTGCFKSSFRFLFAAYSFFDNTSHTVCEKTAIHSLVCLLRSLLLTTCSVIVQTSSTIWQFSFQNGQKP